MRNTSNNTSIAYQDSPWEWKNWCLTSKISDTYRSHIHTHTHTPNLTPFFKTFKGSENSLSPCWGVVVWPHIFFWLVFNCSRLIEYNWTYKIILYNIRTRVIEFVTNGYKKKPTVPRIHDDGTYHDIWHLNLVVPAYILNAKFSNHTTILQVEYSGGTNFLCNLHHNSYCV